MERQHIDLVVDVYTPDILPVPFDDINEVIHLTDISRETKEKPGKRKNGDFLGSLDKKREERRGSGG